MQNLEKSFEKKLKEKIAESEKVKERILLREQEVSNEFEEHKEKTKQLGQDLEKAVNLIQETIIKQKEVSGNKIELIQKLITWSKEREAEVEEYIREFEEEVRKLLVIWEAEKKLEAEKKKKTFLIIGAAICVASIVFTFTICYFLWKK